MHWKTACLESKYELAVRQNKTRLFLRNINNGCTMHNKRTGNTITAPKDLIEGYYDWMPYNNKKFKPNGYDDSGNPIEYGFH